MHARQVFFGRQIGQFPRVTLGGDEKMAVIVREAIQEDDARIGSQQDEIGSIFLFRTFEIIADKATGRLGSFLNGFVAGNVVVAPGSPQMMFGHTFPFALESTGKKRLMVTMLVSAL